jgi:hypothetical protein
VLYAAIVPEAVVEVQSFASIAEVQPTVAKNERRAALVLG